jgi:formylglycine-generating enzyme required for sulfatase activity
MISKIQIAIVLFFMVIVSSCVLAKTTPTKPEEVPGMVFIKGGTFQMGEKGDQKTVTVGDFYIGKYEVTNKEYCQYDPNHKGSWSSPNYPVESVSWDDTVNYCNWLSKKSKKNYRLPTEAEWEYACRAGSTTDYYWGDNMDGNYCWYSENANGQVHQVGQKKSNALGLYDMAGNVYEWCSDWYDSSKSDRSMRGGGWINPSFNCLSGFRSRATPDCH